MMSSSNYINDANQFNKKVITFNVLIVTDIIYRVLGKQYGNWCNCGHCIERSLRKIRKVSISMIFFAVIKMNTSRIGREINLK